MREYDSPHEKLRSEFEILMGQNNTVLREMPAYTISQLFQLVDAYRRKHGVGLDEVREEDDGVYLLMLTNGEVSDEIASAVGIDDPARVGDLDVHMIDDRKMGGSA